MVAARRARPPPGPPKTIEDLRPLILGPELTRLQQVERRLDEHLGDMVADVLPESVVKSRARGDALAWALAPLLETSIRDVVRRDPAGFAESIAPALGPSLREAVRAALAAALQRLDVMLEQSLTLRSMRWRLEARRTGRPYAEVVLLRTLLYQVEQVFLIHRATGLVLQHVDAEQIPTRDPDQVAAMLSAIETFVSEAFDEEKARLERFRVGDLNGWVAHGPEAMLVAVVRGTAPEDYEGALRQTLERVHLERAADLADFRGAPAPFASTRDLLVDCLRESRRERRPAWVAPLAAALALAAIPAFFIARDVRAGQREERRLATYADTLRQEPGLVLLEAKRSDGRFLLAGLRDPLARDPTAVLARSGLDTGAAVLRFEPFFSLDPRLTQELIARERATARALESTEVRFDVGATSPAAEERTHLDQIAGETRRLFAEAPRAGMAARVTVIGHADPTGPDAYNRELARARAEGVVDELRARGVDGALSAQGGGVRARSVMLHVDLGPLGAR